jgi:hypothetical protein|tara:strand:+ start:293 stop:736 length:444 start_codon:yes stop_codon:yes gene_type:complete
VATTAYKTISRAVAVGQDFENVASQLGKWFTATSDIRKAQDLNKRAPLFKKVFAGGSVEEEALELLIQEKKIQEMEKDLRSLLNFRYGHKTWEEMIELRRKIAKQRDKDVYQKIELRNQIFEFIAIVIGIGMGLALLYGFILFLMTL